MTLEIPIALASPVAMKQCPVCSVDCDDALCECGYSFDENMIVDWARLKTRLDAIPRSTWPRRVRLICRANRIQFHKGGSGRQTAKQLGCSAMTISRAVQLADALDSHPELEACRNEGDARRKLGRIEKSTAPDHPAPLLEFDVEADLQKYLAEHWDEMDLGVDWKLQQNGHVDTCEIGIIDLLAKHRSQSRWLVVELKVLKTSDQVLGQVLRYMGWVKKSLSDKNDTVEGLVIASSPDLQTLYGLTCVRNVRMMLYRRLLDSIELRETNLCEHLVAPLSDDEKRRLLGALTDHRDI